MWFQRVRMRRRLAAYAGQPGIVLVAGVVPDLLTRAGTVDFLLDAHHGPLAPSASAQISVAICRWLELYAPKGHRVETLPRGDCAAICFADPAVAARFALAFAHVVTTAAALI